MNSNNYIVPPSKVKFAMNEAQNTVGGKEKYYEYDKPLEFDYYTLSAKRLKMIFLPKLMRRF